MRKKTYFLHNLARPTALGLPAAGLARRLAAAAYDCLLLLAVIMIASIPLVALRGEPIPVGNLAYRAGLLLLSMGFFALFWTRGGQTLGMRAWRLRVVTFEGRGLRFRTAALRSLGALASVATLGLGFLWMVVDPDHLTWHDRWSRTQVIVEPKSKDRR